YWPETGLTAPGDEALKRDVALAKAMGFNGVRKHQKIEDPRYLYWADTLGLLVWEEMPSAYRFKERSVERLTQEWLEVLDRDFSHPSIISWVPFNESWGVPDLPSLAEQRSYVQALYHLTKTLDPERPVIGNDGWESAATDIIGIHDYEHDLFVLERRYHQTGEVIPHLFKRERPAGRLITLEGHQHEGQPIVLSEFGGIAYAKDKESTWGYTRARSPKELKETYTKLLKAVRAYSLLAGFCYTQFADTYQEANGLLYEDRSPKIPLEDIALATSGKRKPHKVKRQARHHDHMIMFKRRADEASADEDEEAG
ncbi:MAG: glycoside hydrolase family 2, partial [Deinococcota bacterium]|nr:glycoside hydrolase family 2 [Deinococcota bacterium]